MMTSNNNTSANKAPAAGGRRRWPGALWRPTGSGPLTMHVPTGL